MSQWRKTFFSLGGPEFIPDPRVDEAAQLGQLLLARQAQAQGQGLAQQRLKAELEDAAARRAMAERGMGLDEQQFAAARFDADRNALFREAQAAREAGFDERRLGLSEAGFAREGDWHENERLFREAEAARRASLDERNFGLERERFAAGRADSARDFGLRSSEAERRAGLDERQVQLAEGRYAREADWRQADLARHGRERNEDWVRGIMEDQRRAAAQQTLAKLNSQEQLLRASEAMRREQEAKASEGLNERAASVYHATLKALADNDEEAALGPIVNAFFPGPGSAVMGPDGKPVPAWQPTTPEQVDQLWKALDNVLQVAAQQAGNPTAADRLLAKAAQFARAARASTARSGGSGQ